MEKASIMFRRIKKHKPKVGLCFLVREAGLEPARPEWTLEPESSESANSTTRALFAVSRLLKYINTWIENCQELFSAFFIFSQMKQKSVRGEICLCCFGTGKAAD